MRLLFHAIRAVSVELLGVLLVLWLLFGAAIWTFESPAGSSLSAAGNLPLEQTLAGWLDDARRWLATEPDTISDSEVAERLDHYSKLYRDAVARHFSEQIAEMSHDPSL